MMFRSNKFSRRHFAALGIGAAALAATAALAQAPTFFRIGTGGTAGTYYPVGGMIANAVSNPPNLVVTAVASNGSLANVNSIAGGALESGFSQADVAFWAFPAPACSRASPRSPICAQSPIFIRNPCMWWCARAWAPRASRT